MAENSWPSPGHNSRAVTDSEYEKVAARFSDDGMWGHPGDSAVVSAGVGLSVNVRANAYASLRGHAWHSGTSTVNLPVAANTSGSTRIDRIVLRLDRAAWTVRAAVLQGIPGSGAPALTQNTGDTGVYEVLLASVTVLNRAASVSVTRAELYIGSRTRPCKAANLPLNPAPGQQAYEVDTGILRLWTGSTWVVLHQDSGPINLGAGYNVWASAGGSVGRLLNGIVTLRIAKERVTTPLSSGASAGSMVATVPALLRPSDLNHFFPAQFSGGQSARVEVRTDGEVWVRALSETVPAGSGLFLTMTYIRW